MSYIYIYIYYPPEHLSYNHTPVGAGGHSKVCSVFGPASLLVNMLVTGYQARLDGTPLFLIKFSMATCISLASCMRWSICPLVLSDLEVPLKSIQ